MTGTGTCGWRSLEGLDPRRSLGAGAIWLIVTLAATFSISAALWVGSIARKNVLEQHVRRLLLETDQLSSDVGQAVAVRLDALSAAGRILEARNGGRGDLREVLDELVAAYPELDWIGAASPEGTLQTVPQASLGKSAQQASTPPASVDVRAAPWFTHGLQGAWLGSVAEGTAPEHAAGGSSGIGDLAAPVHDAGGRLIGVIAAHLTWRRAPIHPERLTDEPDPGGAEAYILDREGTVLVGPSGLRGQRWRGTPIDEKAPAGADIARFERLPGGRRVLVAREPLSAGSEVSTLGWQVQLGEPEERVYQRANALAVDILWVSLCLGTLTCLVGGAAARQLTKRLERLTESVASVGQNPAERIAVPGGLDEVARLGHAFAALLDDLHEERRELRILSSELERRVAVRTREVERLAEESRFAAIVRERLKIARDLHDTLAHSMMALLSEIRFLRKLQARDPAAVGEELARAEQVAREGLKEARSAITQMRVNAVRETGLGPALAHDFERFVNRTGLAGELSVDPQLAGFGDERAETILRMAQEALRNVERHAMASRVTVRLGARAEDELELVIEDDGVGFDAAMAHPGHFGLVGLREQADLIGARLEIDSAPRRGARITVRLRITPVAFAQSEMV